MNPKNKVLKKFLTRAERRKLFNEGMFEIMRKDKNCPYAEGSPQCKEFHSKNS